MAYVLVAVGALMAAAGFFVIGYGWFDARFEEFWTALGAGATLTAGGLVTLALGFAVRALLQVKAVLAAQAFATPALRGTNAELSPTPVAQDTTEALLPAETEPTTAERTKAESTTAEPAIVEPPMVASPTEPQLPLELDVAPPTETKKHHPLRPPPVRPAKDKAASRAPMTVVDHTNDDQGSFDPLPAVDAPPIGGFQAEHPQDRDAMPNEPGVGSTSPEDVPVARPADDYKLDTSSTREPDRSGTNPIKRVPPSMPVADDWFDRALADIDEELPLHAPPVRNVGPDAAQKEPVASAPEPALEPAMAVDESVQAAPEHGEGVATAPPTAPEAPPSAVIGRYEADGTSYVMYADGSIEAQSSAGVYRFSSMAELKSFIEN